MEQIRFYKYPEHLMSAHGYVSPKTGKLIELSANDKNIYLVMVKRNVFFTQQGKTHFDKQEDIAKLCAVSVKQVGRVLRGFIEEGVITAHKGSSGEHKNWRYEKVFEIKLYRIEAGGEVVFLDSIHTGFWGNSEAKQKPLQHKQKPVTYKPQQTVPDWLDESDLPF